MKNDDMKVARLRAKFVAAILNRKKGQRSTIASGKHEAAFPAKTVPNLQRVEGFLTCKTSTPRFARKLRNC